MQQVMEILSSQAWSNFIWALVHSLWIGAFCALGLALTLRGISCDKPERRYRAGLGGLIGLLAGTLIAWGILEAHSNRSVALRAAQEMTVVSNAETAPAATPAPGPAPNQSAIPPRSARPWVAWAAAMWLAGLSAMIIRLINQMVDVKRVRNSCVDLREGPACEMARALGEKLGLKKVVRVATSAMTSVPAALGVVYPTILLPLSMATGLPAEQLRAILAHELAHIRRHDYAVNLLQQLLEALLFFNPAVWWINKQVRNEREASCDLIAAGLLEAREDYARALTDWLAMGREAAAANLQPAFPGDNRPETILERMQRLLTPNYKPILRVPWHSFVAVLCVSTLCLFTAWRGSQFAVAIAADLLSPAERINKIAEIRKTHGEEVLPGPDEEILVSGTIRTHDGKPLPRPLQAHLNVKTYRSNFAFVAIEVKDGRFERKVKRGKIFMSVGGEGYATAFIGPIEATVGQSLTNIEIVLPQGFATKIRVIDPNGNPVAKAKLTGSYQHPAGWRSLERVTDESGEAALTELAHEPMSWEIRAPGFQATRFEGRPLEANASTVWTISKARMTKGVVVARDSGKPVPEAAIKLIARHPTPSFQSMPEHAEVIARTDSEGKFTLDNLVDGAKHVLVVESKGTAPKVVYDVLAGQGNLMIELGPEIILSGIVSGDLEQLKSWDGQYVISVVNPLKMRDDSENHYSTRVPVTVEAGQGRFTVTNLREGKVSIAAGNQTQEFELTKSLTNISITSGVPETPIPNAEREVIIRFVIPPRLPPVKGALKYHAFGQSGGVSEPGFSVVTNNEVRLKSPVPGFVSYEMSGIIGYWAPQEHAQRVEPGNGPMILEVRPLPAGAIYGHVRDHDGSELSGVLISVVEVEAASAKSSSSLGDIGKNSASDDDGPTKFVVQPLPLGGTYRLVAHKGTRYVASDPIELSEKEPIKQVEMRLATGITLPIKVVDENGKPLQGIEVDLSYAVGPSHSFGISGPSVSDANGQLTFPGINPDLPGSYEVLFGSGFGGKRAAHFQPFRQNIDFRKLPVTMRLSKGLTLRGKILNDATGNPLSGAECYVTPVESEAGASYINSDAKSDADGSFEFTTLKPIEYWLGCRDGEIVQARGNSMNRIRVRGGQETAVTFRIIPHQGVRLTENGKSVARNTD